MAWLNTTPEKTKATRLESFKKTKGEHAPELELPALFPSVEHLVGYLFRVGPRSGEGSLSWQEVVKFQEATGVHMSAWEAETLVTMAREYVYQMQESRDPHCPPPFLSVKPRTAEQQKGFENRFKQALQRAAKPAARVQNQRKRM